MDFSKLQRIANGLSLGTSRFQLAQLKREAEQGKGKLASLTRFEMAQLTQLYEHERKAYGVVSDEIKGSPINVMPV